MDEQQRHLLIYHRKAFGDDLRTEDILSYLQSKLVLNIDDVELIKHEITSRSKVEKLLDILPGKGRSAFCHFSDALIDAEYKHLADLLWTGIKDFHDSSGKTLSNDKDKVETILREGGVPLNPITYTPRPDAIRLLRSPLMRLRESPGWVILHGMAGSGKTVLASSILNDAKLLADCFPGGIFWLSLGSVDGDQLFMKMQNLCTWLDKREPKTLPRNWEDARNILRTILLHQYPRSLLVLDDLWSSDHARYFDVQARILVTTRYSSVGNCISALSLKVHMPENLTVEQAKELLSAHIGLLPAYLPSDAESIIAECRGSPLAIALIGALLKSHPDRWKYYLDQLKDSKVSKLRSKLAYEYPTLFDAIDITVKNLPEVLKKKFKYFALFEEGVKVPARVFSILWQKEVEEVEDIVDELIAYSLVKRQPLYNEDGHDAYGIHDLQLDYLRESMSLPGQQPLLRDLHQELITGYSTLCQDQWEKLTNDQYIHWHLVKHLVKGGRIDVAVKLFTSFSWIAAMIRITGSSPVITSYDFLIQNTTNQVQQQLKEFRNFIGAHANRWREKTKNLDMIQLALSNPLTLTVYQKAKEEAKREVAVEKKCYLDWSNFEARSHLESAQEPILTVQHHKGAVFSCHVCPTEESNTVVSCDGDSLVKVWTIDSGELLTSLEGHLDTVYCCRFSSDGERIVTCSADRTVKTWSVQHKRLILSMEGHQGDIYCCEFSPDGKNVISCSVDKTIRIWDSSSGFPLCPLMGHTDVVNWCAHSPDGSKIASASNDLTVKIWDAATNNVIHSLSESEEFYSLCAFTSTGEELLAITGHFVQVFHVEDGVLMKHIVTSASIICVAHSTDGRLAATGNATFAASLWDLEKEKLSALLEGHAGFVRGISFNKAGNKVVTASEDGTCKVWEIGKESHHATKLRKLFVAEFGMDDQVSVIAVDEANKLKKLGPSDVVAESETLPSHVTVCEQSPDGTHVCTACRDGSVQVFSAVTLQLQWNEKVHSSAVSYACFAKDAILVTSSEDGDIQVLDIKAKQLIHTLSGHQAEVTRLVAFGNGYNCLSSAFDGTLKVWNIANGTCDATFTHVQNETLHCCDVSFDGSQCISGCADGTAKLWDINSGRELYVLRGHSDCVRSVKFAPNAKTVLTGGDDGVIQLWDTKSGASIHKYLKHNLWVRDLHFAVDGSRFVSVSDEIKLWGQTELVQTFPVRGSFVRYVRVSNDFKTFVTIDDRGELYIVREITVQDSS